MLTPGGTGGSAGHKDRDARTGRGACSCEHHDLQQEGSDCRHQALEQSEGSERPG